MSRRNDKDVVRGREHPTDGPLELRVHGIGDHRRHTAAGTAPVFVLGEGRETDVVGPAVEPAHQLRKLDWSRTSRTLARLLWFAALPFTLVNVAAEMGPPPRTRGRGTVFRMIMAGFALVVTVAAQIWSVALVETLMRRLRTPALSVIDLEHPAFPAVFVALVLGGGVLARVVFLRRTGSPPASLVVGTAHIAVIAAACVAMVVSPPTGWKAPFAVPALLSPVLQVRVPVDPSEVEAFMEDPRSVPSELHLDPIAGMLVTTLALGLLLAVLLVAAEAVSGLRRAERPVNLTMAGVAILLAIGILHVYGSALRLGADLVLDYLDTRDAAFPFVQRREGADRIERLVMPLQASRSSIASGLIDRASLFLALGLAILLLVVLVVHVVRAGSGGHGSSGGTRWTRRAAFVHDLIAGLPRSLPLGFLIAVPLWVAASAGLLHLVLWVLVVREATVPLSQGIAILAVYVIATGGAGGRLRASFSVIADVAGFWPVATHPLAGRSYRTLVMRGIDEQLLAPDGSLRAGPTVLVGHSQGSVLCAWWVHRCGRRMDLDLVLCGSPLASLYASFFPATFSADFFGGLARDCRSVRNFWRDTDPIATPLPFPTPSDEQLADPRDRSITHPRGHSDYWSDPVQMTYIASRLARASASSGGLSGG